MRTITLTLQVSLPNGVEKFNDIIIENIVSSVKHTMKKYDDDVTQKSTSVKLIDSEVSYDMYNTNENTKAHDVDPESETYIHSDSDEDVECPEIDYDPNHATLYVLSVNRILKYYRIDDMNYVEFLNAAAKIVTYLKTNYPDVYNNIRHGDILENSAECGDLCNGRYIFNVSKSGNVVKIERLCRDPYGTRGIPAEFNAFTKFPYNYWDDMFTISIHGKDSQSFWNSYKNPWIELPHDIITLFINKGKHIEKTKKQYAKYGFETTDSALFRVDYNDKVYVIKTDYSMYGTRDMYTILSFVLYGETIFIYTKNLERYDQS